MTTTQDTPEAQADEVEVLVPLGDTLKITSVPDEEGRAHLFEVRVRRLKTIELLSLLRILTAGLGPGTLTNLRLDTSDSTAFGIELLTLLTLALPQAAAEFVGFINMIADPVDTNDEPQLREALRNPEPEVILDIFEIMASQEAEDVLGLVGKVKALWSRVGSLYTKKGKTKAPRSAKPAT